MNSPTRFIFTLITGVALALPNLGVLKADPLHSAALIETKGEVTVEKNGEKRDAALNDLIQDKDSVTTGKKSRAELEFTDKSIARLGANTSFSFDPQSRNMKLDRGTALVHVPPGLSGAVISTPAATAAISGDVIAVRVNENGNTDIVALSQDSKGPIQVTFNKTGEMQTLRPGQLLSINPLATKMPHPVTINVQAFTKGSNLIKAEGGFKTELPKTAQAEIKNGLAFQLKEIKNGNLEAAKKLYLSGGLIKAVAFSTVLEKAITSSAGNGVKGFFAGATVNGPGSVFPGAVGKLVFEIFSHGGVKGFHVNAAGKVVFFNGRINRAGQYVFDTAKGEVFTGEISKGSGSGTFESSNGTVSGTLKVKRL